MKYESDELMNEGTSIVYFGAEWCGPCKMLGPIFEKVVDTYTNESSNINFYKIDVDVEAALSMQYGVRNIPLILKLENGEVVGKHIGALSESKLFDFIGNANYKII
jgi:thioredoxin 1